MSSVVDEDGKPFPGKGFAIKPSAGKIYAPFDGKIRFTFGTKHAFEIISDNGLQVVVHVVLGTVTCVVKALKRIMMMDKKSRRATYY
ncbi:hypothetical protein LANSK_18210 [Lactobacillus amylovorus subsp. amylovorus]